MNDVMKIQTLLKEAASVPAHRAAAFFKTGAGDYAAHDVFMGVSVPTLRTIAKQGMLLTVDDLQLLLQSAFNEERLLALIILTQQYSKADASTKEMLYQFYLQNLEAVNNWNLVDSSAHLIVGAHLWDKDRSILLTLAASEMLWERRIAIVATWYFIRQNDLAWTFNIATLLRDDPQDLIHKAVGWMLREAGKRSLPPLEAFLAEHAPHMPRTMLRYAVEKFPEQQRKHYYNL